MTTDLSLMRMGVSVSRRSANFDFSSRGHRPDADRFAAELRQRCAENWRTSGGYL